MTAQDTSTHGDQALDNALFQAAVDALDRADIGIILTDREATVNFTNEAARASLSGPLLLLQGNRLDCANKPATARLHSVIREVTGGPRTSCSPESPRPKNRDGSHLLIAGINLPADGTPRPLALLLLSPTAGRAPHDHAEYVQLTPAESRLLRALVGGQQIGPYAAEAGISLATVKTHLRGLFDKTGERRQSALILRALSDPILLAQWRR